MIIKSFNLNDLKKKKSNVYLLYGENEGLKEEIVQNFFLNGFNGEIIKYDENQIIENKNNFFETCFNESLFENQKIILINRISSKFYEIVNELKNKEMYNKKIVINSGNLEKKSKIRQLFEKEKNLICIPLYKDNNSTLMNIANNFFKEKKISISYENINIIIDKCSGDRKNLKNELDKILNYSLKKGKINTDEILKLINLYEDESYFELIDNCLSKNHNKVCKIINNNNYTKSESIIIIRTFLLRIKRLLELKKLEIDLGSPEESVNNFKPAIFWKDKEAAKKQVEIWSMQDVYKLLEEINSLEITFKTNSNLSNNLIFDKILNTSNNLL